MIGKLDQALQFNETVLRLRGQRQQVIASNIANADTPNFKARDIDFGKALQQALGTSMVNQAGSVATTSSTVSAATATLPALATTAANHLQGSGRSSGGLDTPLLYRTPIQASIDGNTVEMDAERNQFADNSIRYEAGLTFISAQIKSLLAAVQG
jgi:flagellar basal-body rod protein FlgB